MHASCMHAVNPGGGGGCGWLVLHACMLSFPALWGKIFFRDNLPFVVLFVFVFPVPFPVPLSFPFLFHFFVVFCFLFIFRSFVGATHHLLYAVHAVFFLPGVGCLWMTLVLHACML